MCINPQHTIYSFIIKEVTAPRAHSGTTSETQLVAQGTSFPTQLFHDPTCTFLGANRENIGQDF